jgi:hypothetical protein
MQQFKRSSVHFPWHHLTVFFLSLLALVAGVGGLALLVLDGSMRSDVARALGFALWALLLALLVGVGAYGLLLLAGRIDSSRRFAPTSDRAEEGWSALLLAALGGLWVVMIFIWMSPSPHNDLLVLIWLLASIALGFASIRRLLVRALVRLLGPKHLEQ